MSELVLPSIFSDELVLQRGRTNPIWGWDVPGRQVALTVYGPSSAPLASATTVVASNGSFCFACPELPAGGPYRLHFQGSGERVVDRVLVGEVWLASGQSNMEWKVSQSNDAPREIATAMWPGIRMFNVAHQTGRQPERTVAGQWRSCEPNTVDDFSAVAYFFARELYRELNVPIGIINASWGGTPVEAWASVEALRQVMDVDGELGNRAVSESDLAVLRRDYDAALVRWEHENLPADIGNAGESKGWADADFDDENWPSMPVPGIWQAYGLNFNGVVWFRRTIELPEAWAGHDLVIRLGAIDDFDHTYFNGVLVGSHPKGTPGAYQIPRVYRVPGERVKPGKNVIAVRVFDHFGEGGLLGPTAEMVVETTGSAHARLPLSGKWRYAVERQIPFPSANVFRTYPHAPLVLQAQNAPGALFCGMIAPLIPFGLRGVIWYQGESNVEQHRTYRDRFVALIRDFRSRFEQPELPFYFAQLANYIASPDWPSLREAQADALSEPATGMAVTLDIGDPEDIHPRNKQEVGRRLSLLALARTYGRRDLEDSGPALERAEFLAGKVRLRFSHAAGLRAHGGGAGVTGFTVAGDDDVHHPARARIEGDHVVVDSPRVPAPKAVRYAWADDPEADLENGAGLPAAPFRTDR
jgi:sialate O-acetylesterase